MRLVKRSRIGWEPLVDTLHLRLRNIPLSMTAGLRSNWLRDAVRVGGNAQSSLPFLQVTALQGGVE